MISKGVWKVDDEKVIDIILWLCYSGHVLNLKESEVQMMSAVKTIVTEYSMMTSVSAF